MKLTAETALSPSGDSQLQADLSGRSGFPQNQPRRRTGNRGGGLRLRRQSRGPGSSSRRGSRPETPFLVWKNNEGIARSEDTVENIVPVPDEGEGGRRSVPQNRPAVSARKLAAALWLTTLPAEATQRTSLQTGGSHFGKNKHWKPENRVEGSPLRELASSPRSVSGGKHWLPFKRPNTVMEGATKWDPDGVNVSKPGEPRRSSAATVVSALETELDHAKARVSELEAESRSSKKKLEQFLHKLGEEKAAWICREHERVRVIMNEMKSEINTEKKNRQRLEMINSKLVNELANVKLAAKRYVQEYEKERKARELTEEVCDELAKEIGEDKAEVEALKRDSMRVREEVDQERKMLQLAEVWREERVQMKLVDAKVMLEEKYSQMNQIIADLESFLRSTADSGEIKKAQFLKQVAASVSMQDVRNMNYEPPNPDEIFSIFEDAGESHNREGELSAGYCPASHTTNVQLVSPVKKHSKDKDPNAVVEDDTSEWETVTQPEDQVSSYSAFGSDPSVGRDYASGFRAEWEVPPVMEFCEAEHGKTKQSKKGLVMSKLWKSWSGSGDKYKTISVDGKAGRRANGANLSTENGSTRGDYSSPYDLGEQGNSPDTGNSHITLAKGCIDESSVKAKLVEARTENQKIQLRQVLQQKM